MELQRSPALQDFSKFIAFTPSPTTPSPSLSASALAFDAPPAPSRSKSAFKAPKPQPRRAEEAVSPFTNHHNDPIFFTDPLLTSDIADFFGINTTAQTTAGYYMRAQHPFNHEASYNFPEDFGVRDNPAADDLETFMNYGKREEQIAVEHERREMAEREKVMVKDMRDEVDLLSQPVTIPPRKIAKAWRGGNRR